MVFQSVSSLKAVAIVPCKSLNEAEFTTFMKENEGIFSHTIFSTQNVTNWVIEEPKADFTILNFPSQSGISAARNRGLESACISSSIIFFPNLTTRFSLDYVSHVLKLFSGDRSIGCISGRYVFQDQKKKSFSTGPLNGHNLFEAYEPTLAISGEVLSSQEFRFDEKIGTGNSWSKRWSGEGTELLFRLRKSGFKVIKLNKIASYDSRNAADHQISVDIKYARGYIYVCRVISGNFEAVYRAFRTLNKLIPIGRKDQFKSLKFRNSVAFVFGSFVELLSIENRKQAS